MSSGVPAPPAPRRGSRTVKPPPAPALRYPAESPPRVGDRVRDTDDPAPAWPHGQGLFITGTDTDCGKTEVTLALMHALAARGLRVLGMKPVATGARPGPDGLMNSDARRLLAAGSFPMPYGLVNPYAFAPAIAPHVAAGMDGVVIDAAPILDAYRTLAAQADRVLVEGVGGWRVPLGPSLAVSDLPLLLDLPVVLVVGLRLGCLNHSLLSAEAIRASGARLVGWIANCRDPAMAALDENIATLAALIDAPNLGVLPCLSAPDPAALAEHLHLEALLA